MRGFTIDQTMGTIRLGLKNTRNVPEVKIAAETYGYDENRLTEGDALFREVETLREHYDFKNADAIDQCRLWQTASKEARRLYIMHLELTRCALQDSPFLWRNMEMKGRRDYSFDGWTNQAKVLYNRILDDEIILSKLAQFNLTREKIEKGLELVEKAITALHNLVRLRAEAKDARVTWDRALAGLKKWYSNFRAVLRIALAETPAMLKAVGIPVKLTRGKANGKQQPQQALEPPHAHQLPEKKSACEKHEKETAGKTETAAPQTEKDEKSITLSRKWRRLTEGPPGGPGGGFNPSRVAGPWTPDSPSGSLLSPAGGVWL